MKIENSPINDSLESLEKCVWPPLDSSESSYLVQTCHTLRKKHLKDFSIEDFRIMIGQNIGLNFLIPLAIDILKSNILAEGDFYEGDLLKSVLTSDKEYWRVSTGNFKAMCNLFEQNESKLMSFDTTSEIKKAWFDSYTEFKTISKNEK